MTEPIVLLRMLKKIPILSVLVWQLLTPVPAFAAESSDGGIWEFLPEIILRPFGFLSVLGGSALFVAASPLTAAASIEAPHDAWSNSFNGFVAAPIRYTFTRPIGDYRFETSSR
ncbi:MAG: hypothetical protein ACU843_05390 [Gammaproteobacteria bacterium]